MCAFHKLFVFLLPGTLNTLLASNKKSAIENTINFFLDWLMMTEVVLKESSVQDLMVSNHTFDAVICEVFLSEALFGLSEHFNAPLIGLSAYGASMWNTDLVIMSFHI